MSQIFKTEASTPPPPGFVEFLEGNDSVAVGPNGSDVIFVVGDGSTSSGVSIAGNIVVTNTSANTETISPTQAQFMTNYTSVSAASYNITATDYYISCDPTANAITLNLPAAPGIDRLFIIKDRTGQAATHNITITGKTIDGLTSYVMNSNYQAVNLLYNGSAVEVF